MRNRFDRQLELLNDELIKMGALCEKAIATAVEAMQKNDKALIKQTVLTDSDIDRAEKDIEQLCLRLLLQQQPVAKDLRVICAQAADELLTVSDVDASFVLFETDGTANISARSMGKVNVQLIMESLGGGGHQTMSAAQLADTALPDAEKQLYAAIDAYFENQ